MIKMCDFLFFVEYRLVDFDFFVFKRCYASIS